MPSTYLPPYRHAPVPWTRAIYLPVNIPWVRDRRRLRFVRIPFLNVLGFHQYTITHYGKRKGRLLLAAVYLMTFFALVFVFQVVYNGSTLVFRRQDLRQVWQWEVASGHYPSRRRSPDELDVESIENPARPPFGPERVHINVENPNGDYASRPLHGSIADLDIIMDHCDVEQGMYVRDCLEMLRVGAGLDSANKSLQDSTYIFVENTASPKGRLSGLDASGFDFRKRYFADWEPSPLSLPPVKEPPFSCDPDDPRIFHMYWTGDFTDKPYMAIMSFLFTQNLGLHVPEQEAGRTFCRPKLWVWINPLSASQAPHENAPSEMLEELRQNPWSAPFLHPRLKRVVQLKFWDTAEMLDGLPELKDDWRKVHSLFKSFGKAINSAEDSTQKGPKEYDRLSVIMSDMARFLLCHRFGGIYLDADVLFLRDWEELWGWRGSFSYRWSIRPRYNTAVLRLRKGSALGTFILRTALRNDLDFHPITVTQYLKDAHLDGLLYRVPDALFDPAWLNTDGYQRDRPPQPYFKAFRNFFDAPSAVDAAPQALGFDGFFRGAYAYHFHNSWWKKMDLTQNYPNLGPKLTHMPLSTDDDTSILSWSAVLKRTFEAYIRGERPNMYGEWILW